MKKKAKNGALAGLSFAGIAFAVVKTLGFNRQSFMILSYLYVISGVVVAVLHERKLLKSVVEDFVGNIVVVDDGEELVLKKLFTGEKYEVKGSLEKVQ